MTDALRKKLARIAAACCDPSTTDALDKMIAGLDQSRAALAAPAVPPGWQPIETAPAYPFVKERWYVDGPRYLLSTGSSVFIGQYGYTERGKGRWQDHYGRNCQPTHWMPLPAAPTAQQEPKP